MKKINLYVMLIAFPLSLWAQKKVEKTHEFPRLRFGVDTGIEIFMGTVAKNPNIRENQSYYSNQYYDDDVYNSGFMFNSYNYLRYGLGVKTEYSLSHRVVVAAGLRFSMNASELNSDGDYFLWKTGEENTTTNYVRIKKINQNNYYFGIPLEVKVFPIKSDLFVRQYVKAGMLFNLLVASNNAVFLVDKTMEKYSNNINRQIGKPSVQSGYFYLGVGMKIGRMNRPFGSIEMQVPVRVFKNRKLASFIEEPDAGIGLQATIYIPKGKKKLSYIYKKSVK